MKVGHDEEEEEEEEMEKEEEEEEQEVVVVELNAVWNLIIATVEREKVMPAQMEAIEVEEMEDEEG